MTHVEIVTHCWRYAGPLACQLGSFALHPPSGEVRVTVAVYCSREDVRTIELLDRFERVAFPANVRIEREEDARTKKVKGGRRPTRNKT